MATITGTPGNDTLSSSTSGTILQGGLGDDLYIIGGSGVTVTELAGEGTDEIQTTLATYSIASYAHVERLTYTGSAAFTGTGNAADNAITGNTGNDTLNGGAGNDVLDGGAGNDVLIGGDGADQLIGGAGTDTASYAGATAAVTINLATGVHTGFAAGDTFDSIETFLGSNYNDTFIGDSNGNNFNGGSGTDTIDYSASTSAVNVNLTTNVVSGGDAQGDTLAAIEKVIGTDYNDTLASSTSGRTLQGGLGDDLYIVGGSGVTVTELAGEGTDEIQTTLATYSIASYAHVERLTYTGSAAFTGTGNAADNAIAGNTGNDTLNGGAGNDVLDGGAGNDVLIGGDGADQLIGGAGTDTASYAGAAAAVTLNLATGVHTGFAAGDTFDSIETFLGSNYNDTFIGDSNGNNFNGGSGTDTIDYSASTSAVNVNLTTNVVSGGDAQGDTLAAIEKVIGTNYNDTLASSTSSHTLQGGLGDDVYIVTGTSVTVIEAAGAGTDEIQTTLATLSIASYANIERLTYTGSAAFTGTGNAADNAITGNTGNDTLNGGAGNDVLDGGAGNDVLIGGDGADQLIGGAGTDTASYAGATAAVTLNLATGVHTGFAAGDTFDSIETFLGSNYSDTFIGDTNATNFNGGSGTDTIDYSASMAAVNVNLTGNILSGGDAQGDSLTSIEKVSGSAYNDTLASATSGHTLQGGLGDDVYVVTGTGVTVIEAAGAGTDEIQTTIATLSLASYANIERLTYTGSAAFTGTGNADDNVITGGSGNDTLFGGAGADEFHGGAGVDTVSYNDSTVGIVLDFSTGVFSGIASGDSFYDIENIAGSSRSDVFIESSDSHSFAGSGGYDIVSYETATSGITINLATATQTDIAAGDILTNIEVIQGSAFDDTLVGDGNVNNFMGGAGADTINGGVGADGAWYLYSSDAIEIDLLAGTVAGGDAAGDTLTGIENLLGSAFDDVLTGDAQNNRLDGGDGNDFIVGGDGGDTIYGAFGNDLGIAENGATQVDILYGDAGNDYVQTGINDAGSRAYGGVGNDTVQVNHGEAYGGEGNDYVAVTGNGSGYGNDGDDQVSVTNAGSGFGGNGQDKLVGSGLDYKLHGENDFDTLDLYGRGEADGGQHGDIYNIYSTTSVALVKDTGNLENDYVFMKKFGAGELATPWRDGDDVCITSIADMLDGYHDSGVRLVGWFAAGGHYIESFKTVDLVDFTAAVFALG